MFGFGRSKTDYEKICEDPSSVFKLLYGDRAKTSEILDDGDFISAWMNSGKQRDITLVIRREAIAGDVPSLKQMVWFLEKMYQEISSASIEKKRKLETLIAILGERVGHCNRLIANGIPYHYQAMVSSHNLYRALSELGKPGTIEKTRDTLNAIVEHAQAVIKMGKSHSAFDGDAGFIADAESALHDVDDYRKFLNALGGSISDLDEKR